jgi:hypothetical protein
VKAVLGPSLCPWFRRISRESEGSMESEYGSFACTTDMKMRTENEVFQFINVVGLSF